VSAVIGALNCGLQNVHTPTTGVELRHFTTRRVRFAMLLDRLHYQGSGAFFSDLRMSKREAGQMFTARRIRARRSRCAGALARDGKRCNSFFEKSMLYLYQYDNMNNRKERSSARGKKSWSMNYMANKRIPKLCKAPQPTSGSSSDGPSDSEIPLGPFFCAAFRIIPPAETSNTQLEPVTRKAS
jgi:hypothetical protein